MIYSRTKYVKSDGGPNTKRGGCCAGNIKEDRSRQDMFKIQKIIHIQKAESTIARSVEFSAGLLATNIC